MQTFSTNDIEVFHQMIALAVKEGLTFEAFENNGHFTLKYTGGF